MSPGRAWIAAIRPRTLPVGVAPVLVGCGFAVRYGVFSPVPAAAALVGALLIQVGTNLANDYYDHRRGADTPDRVGPVRASAAGLLKPADVLAAALSCFVAASAIGLYLVAHAGWPILVIGLASLASGYLYTGGPWPLGYHGFGDLFVFVFFGLVATAGTYFVQGGPAPHGVLVAGAAMGFLATSVLVVNNLRDLETDRAAGKKTLAVLIGRRATQVEYVTLLGLAYLVPIVPFAQGRVQWPFLLPLLTLPLALTTAHRLWHEPTAERLNRVLPQTGLLVFLYGTLFAVGAAL